MRGMDKLHPELVPICQEFVRRCKAAGLNVLVTETLRTKAEQDALYAQGRTKPGKIVTRCKYPQSPHCWGVAFDFCRNEKGREYVDSDGFFAKCGAIGKQLGLTWGGDWTGFVDKPHMELKKYMPNASYKWLVATYGTPEAFFKTWTAVQKTEPTEEKEKPEENEMPDEEENAVVYRTMEDIPDWGKEAVQVLMKRGVLQGDGEGGLNLSQDLLRMCVMLYRLGI